MGFCEDLSCNNATITKKYIKYWRMDIRHRTGWNGMWGVHGGRHEEEFNSHFWNEHMNESFRYLDWAAYTFNNGDRIDWIGDIGATNCKPDSCHRSGNALDVTAIKMTSGTYADMNVDWRSWRPLKNRRLYLAVWAALRIENITVIAYEYNAAHENHIHVDWGGVANHVILRKNKTDTALIQSACNWLNGESLVVDGAWGPNTSAAYNRLLNAFNLDCENPFGNQWSSMRFMRFIAMHGIANRSAGWWQGLC